MLSLDQIKITRRDHEVLMLLVQGCSNKEIAAELNISPRAVKQQLRTFVLARGHQAGTETRNPGNGHVRKGADEPCRLVIN